MTQTQVITDQETVETLERVVFAAATGPKTALAGHLRNFLMAADAGWPAGAGRWLAAAAAADAADYVIEDMCFLLPLACQPDQLEAIVNLEFDQGLWAKIAQNQ